jgi:hypothetical protein
VGCAGGARRGDQGPAPARPAGGFLIIKVENLKKLTNYVCKD